MALKQAQHNHIFAVNNHDCVCISGLSSKHSISTDPEVGGLLLSDSELESRRPDGFKFMTAPLLRGEGNWPSVSLYGTLEQRILHTVDALLARVPFWLKVAPCPLPLLYCSQCPSCIDCVDSVC